MKTIILILSLTTFLAYAEKPSQEEVETYMGAIKEQQVEEQLLGSEQVKACKDAAEKEHPNDLDNRNIAIRSCFAKQLEELDEKSIEQFSENLDLKSFDRSAAKSTTSIKEYLQKRLSEGLRGKDDPKKPKKLKDQKFVSHDVYVKLYKNQIGKTILLDISNYCLQNFGLASSRKNLLVLGQDEAGGYNQLTIVTAAKKVKKDGKEFYVKSDSLNPSPMGFPITDLWKKHSNLKEYGECTSLNDNSCFGKDSNGNIDKNKIVSRPTELLTLLKNAEFEYYKANPEGMGKRYEFCAGSVIQNMCEIYKCNNVYKNTNQEAIAKCNGFGIDLLKKSNLPNNNVPGSELELKENDQKGRLACNLLTRLKNYRKTFKLVEKTEQAYKGMVAKSGVAVKSNFGGVYSGGGGDGTKSIDQITSISSSELVNEVSSFDESAEKAKKLKEECYDEANVFLKDKDECKELLASVDDKTLKNIEIETETETALYLKKLETVKNSKAGKEELEKFLKENGLYEKYKDKLSSLSEDQLIQIIQDNYKAEKMATLNNLKAKFEQEAEISKKRSKEEELKALQGLENDLSQKKIADLEKHKQKVETLYQYSNIVSSYLTVTTKGGKDEGGKTNSISRNIEVSGAKQYAGKGKGQESDLTKYFSNESEDSGSSSPSGGSFVDINFIDKVLGNEAEKPEKGQ